MNQGGVSLKSINGLKTKIVKGEENRYSAENLDANVNN